LRDEGDDFGDFENHVGGRAILQPLTVDIAPNPQVLRVADFVRGHQARSHRGKSVKTFRPKPLALAELNVASADIVYDHVACNYIPCLLRRQVLCPLTDDDGEFHLVIQLRHLRRIDDGVKGSDGASRGFGKKQGVGGRFLLTFFGVVAVVEP